MRPDIPLVDLQAQYSLIQDDIDAAIQRVVKSARFILGPEVDAFEAEFAKYCGADHCVGVSSGTSALELTLRALNVGRGDEVITVSHTFIATAEAISVVGAVPVFVDIDATTYTMDPSAFASAITQKTRAVIPVHLYGHPAHMTRINEIARRHGIHVIEDAAQAHGATWAGRRTGSLGDAACFSFYPGKNLGAYGDAGAVVTKHGGLAEKVNLLRNHGRRTKYVHDEVGLGERLDALQAAILTSKLTYIEEWTTARRKLASRYTELLAPYGLILPETAAQADPVWHLYVVRTPARDRLLAHLQTHRIGAGVHYPVPLHLQPAYEGLGYQRGDLPVTEAVADSCLSLPLFPEMSEEQLELVVESVATAVTGTGSQA